MSLSNCLVPWTQLLVFVSHCVW